MRFFFLHSGDDSSSFIKVLSCSPRILTYLSATWQTRGVFKWSIAQGLCSVRLKRSRGARHLHIQLRQKRAHTSSTPLSCFTFFSISLAQVHSAAFFQALLKSPMQNNFSHPPLHCHVLLLPLALVNSTRQSFFHDLLKSPSRIKFSTLTAHPM